MWCLIVLMEVQGGALNPRVFGTHTVRPTGLLITASELLNRFSSNRSGYTGCSSEEGRHLQKQILAVLTCLMCGKGLIPEAGVLMGKY